MSAFQQYICVLMSIFLVKCQQPERFYFFGFDDEESSGWVENYGTVSGSDILWRSARSWCPRRSAGLQLSGDNACVEIFGNAYLSQVISTAGYHSIHLKIDVNALDVESIENEWCYIQYRTASTEWINTNIINGDTYALGFDVTIPDTIEYNDQSTFEVKIGINGDSDTDSCAYDYLEVIGISYTQNPTNEPTKTPTMATSHPTNAPSSAPTSPPTNAPTFMPTQFPTRSPTADPSLMPIVPTYHDTKDHSPNTSEAKANPIAPVSVFSDTKNVLIVVLVLSFLIIVVLICIIIITIKLRKKKAMNAVKRMQPDPNPSANIIHAHDEPKIMKAPGVSSQQEAVNRLPQEEVLKVTDEGNGGLPSNDMNEVQMIKVPKDIHTTTGNDLEAMNNAKIAEDEFIIDEDHETARDDLIL